MYKIEAKITGITPLRYNRFIINDRQNANKAKMTQEQQIENALERAYRGEKGFYVPAEALRACFINGGKKVKIGRGWASKLLEAIMIFDEDKYYVGTDKYEIEQGVVRIPPRTGARVLQYWILIPQWQITFSVHILDDIFPENGLKDAIQSAGLYYGLLDGRPLRGRFELVEFKRTKGAK